MKAEKATGVAMVAEDWDSEVDSEALADKGKGGEEPPQA